MSRLSKVGYEDQYNALFDKIHGLETLRRKKQVELQKEVSKYDELMKNIAQARVANEDAKSRASKLAKTIQQIILENERFSRLGIQLDERLKAIKLEKHLNIEHIRKQIKEYESKIQIYENEEKIRIRKSNNLIFDVISRFGNPDKNFTEFTKENLLPTRSSHEFEKQNSPIQEKNEKKMTLETKEEPNPKPSFEGKDGNGAENNNRNSSEETWKYLVTYATELNQYLSQARILLQTFDFSSNNNCCFQFAASELMQNNRENNV